MRKVPQPKTTQNLSTEKGLLNDRIKNQQTQLKDDLDIYLIGMLCDPRFSNSIIDRESKIDFAWNYQDFPLLNYLRRVNNQSPFVVEAIIAALHKKLTSQTDFPELNPDQELSDTTKKNYGGYLATTYVFQSRLDYGPNFLIPDIAWPSYLPPLMTGDYYASKFQRSEQKSGCVTTNLTAIS